MPRIERAPPPPVRVSSGLAAAGGELLASPSEAAPSICPSETQLINKSPRGGDSAGRVAVQRLPWRKRLRTALLLVGCLLGAYFSLSAGIFTIEGAHPLHIKDMTQGVCEVSAVMPHCRDRKELIEICQSFSCTFQVSFESQLSAARIAAELYVKDGQTSSGPATLVDEQTEDGAEAACGRWMACAHTAPELRQSDTCSEEYACARGSAERCPRDLNTTFPCYMPKWGGMVAFTTKSIQGRELMEAESRSVVAAVMLVVVGAGCSCCFVIIVTMYVRGGGFWARHEKPGGPPGPAPTPRSKAEMEQWEKRRSIHLEQRKASLRNGEAYLQPWVPSQACDTVRS